MQSQNIAVVLKTKPGQTYPAVDDVFEVRPVTAQTPLSNGQVRVELAYLSVDAAMRVWITGVKTYVDPVRPGDTMFGFGVARVLESPSSGKFQVGDFVSGVMKWQLQQVISEKEVRLVAKKGSASESDLIALLGPLGISGLTAYTGLENIGQPQPGETVVVSTAAGAVGEIAVQLARNHYKCRVIGIAGDAEKCAYVKNELGAVDCINYKTESVNDRLKELCPNGVNVYFDNVGGQILDDVLMHLTNSTRIILCGAISTYNSGGEQYRVKNYPRLIIKKAVMQGYIYTDYPQSFKPGVELISTMLRDGRMKVKYDIQNGLERAPAGLQKLLQGKNQGKVVVRVSPVQPKL